MLRNVACEEAGDRAPKPLPVRGFQSSTADGDSACLKPLSSDAVACFRGSTAPSASRWPAMRASMRVLAWVFLLGPGMAQAVDDVDGLCLDCHRPGAADGVVPALEGQHADYLRAQLQRFQHRHREGFPMNALSAGLHEAQIDALVRDLSARSWRSAQVDGEVGAERGLERLQALDCGGCHGETFRGGGAIPRLAGQQAAYLERQILRFGDADRHHPPVGGGVRMYSLDAEDAVAIAQALAAMR